MPVVSSGVRGRWRIRDPHRLVFTAYGAGFAPASRVTITLPRDVGVMTAAATRTVRQVSWLVPRPTFARLQQLLAQQGYLPFRWLPASGRAPVRTLVGQEQAAVVPPAGHFVARFRLPAALAALWSATSPTVITRAAVMVVERTHNLPVDGVAGAGVWSALIHDAVNGQAVIGGYNYVEVSRARQHLTLYHNGRVMVAAAINTGIPQAPTAAGSYPVFEHIPVGTMSGTNPDGTKYHDPGIPWISYFNGGDALHGFLRASYGSPQSLGCVEMPYAVAGQLYPYTPVGTIVTVDA